MNIVARIVAFLLAAVLPIEESSARTRAVAAGQLTIERSHWVHADPQVVWKAFVEDVDKWWPAELTQAGDPALSSMEPVAGGGLREAGNARPMDIVFVVPGRLACASTDLPPLGGGDHGGALEWDFAGEDGGTRITLRYRSNDCGPEDITEFAEAIGEVQATQLAGLAGYLGHALAEPPARG